MSSLMPPVAVLRKMLPEHDSALLKVCAPRFNLEDKVLTRDAIIDRAQGAEAIISFVSDTIDAEVIHALPTLKMIAHVAVGVSNINLSACRERGIAVSNTPDVLTRTTAELGMALLLSSMRRVGECERWLRGGHWQGWALEQWLGSDLYGANLGIFGLGRIGQEIALRARAFGMNIRYHNRHPLSDSHPIASWCTPCSLADLARTSDALMVLVPYSAQTHHSIDAGILALMKTSARLIVLSRGHIVDEDALINALQGGQIAGAALDVFADEPHINPRWKNVDNAVLTPHIGSATLNCRQAMGHVAIDNLSRFLNHQPLINPVV